MKFKLTILLMFLSTLLFAQSEKQDRFEKHYRQLVKDFYRQLFKESVTVKEFSEIYVYAGYIDSDLTKKHLNTDKMKSELMNSIKTKHFDELTNKLTINEINNVIEKSEISSDGYDFEIIMELPLSKNYSIYFDLDNDIPGRIEYIFLKNAINIGSMDNKEYKEQLFRPGIINESDGYTNLRENPNSKSKVVGILKTNELFFYSPIGDSDWYPVQMRYLGKKIGYIHKSKIIKYSNFPKQIKVKVDKIRGGC